ncbi:unnamed protein product [Pleuronectes platessa]|uniref:Uncharacterized protein n=1 Tax=Pleuronectes platessa TaxID=8262 RepID=A0A9N7YB62_PLEPL|nr:unnamed protein product [Pleuronectes platessa]
MTHGRTPSPPPHFPTSMDDYQQNEHRDAHSAEFNDRAAPDITTSHLESTGVKQARACRSLTSRHQTVDGKTLCLRVMDPLQTPGQEAPSDQSPSSNKSSGNG